MSNVILSCSNLNKKIKKKQILKNVSFEVNKGEILGFIGPNGAGKTTTIKLILGLQSITSGTVKINGFDIEKNFVEAIEKVGAIVENPDFYMYLSGQKNLELIANMYKNIDKSRVDEVVKIVGLENRIKDKVSKYSLGMRQRLGIAQAIINKPNLLILDEPTNGLDPEGIKELRDLLIKLAEKEEMAIFISSHNLAELESFCNKVCIIKNGEIIENTSMSELKQEVSNEKCVYNIEVENTNVIDSILNNNYDDVKILDENRFTVLIKKEDVPELIEKLIKNNVKIYEVYEEKITLEEAFLKRTGGNIIG